MQKTVDLTLGISVFLSLCSCVSTAIAPPVRPPGVTATSPPTDDITRAPVVTSSPAAPDEGRPTVPSPTASASSSGSVQSRPQILAQLRLETDRRLFDASGQTGQLMVIALDAAGAALPPEGLGLRFSSTRPTDFSVSTTGVVKALKDNGFSTIRVTDESSGQFAEITLSVASAGSFSGSSGGGGGGSSNTGNTTPPTLNTTTEFEGLEEDPA